MLHIARLAAFGLAALVAITHADVPVFNDLVNNAALLNSTDELVLMELETLPSGVVQCHYNSTKLVVAVSECFPIAAIQTMLSSLENALVTPANVFYHDDLAIDSQYQYGYYHDECIVTSASDEPKLSAFKFFSPPRTFPLLVDIAKQSEKSATTVMGASVNASFTLDIRVCADLKCGVAATDVLVTDVNRVSALADTIKNLLYCGGLSNSAPLTYTDKQNKKQCQCQCIGELVLLDGKCQCPTGKSLVNGKCTCSGNQTLVNGKCTCPGLQVFTDGKCRCPSGYSMDEGECVPKCFWTANNKGVKCSWKDKKTSLMLMKDCQVIAPVPKDNYVNDLRVNQHDSDATLADPMITITSTNKKSNDVVTKTDTWADYAKSPGTLENKITLNSFGVFDLKMVATDYRHHATCTGCVAVVDEFPPTARVTCGSKDLTGVVSFTSSELKKLMDEEKEFTSFYAVGNVDNNGDFDSVTGANERCDDKIATKTDFFADAASTLSNIDIKCFTSDFAKDLLDSAKSKKSELATKLAISPNSLVCKSCCSKSITLKEHYYDFSCDSTGDAQKLTRSSSTCAFGRCMEMPAATLATATASITTTANAKTTTTLAGLSSPPAADPKTLHRSFTCTTFEDGCSVKAALGDLFTTSASLGSTMPAGYDVKDFVYWRYSKDTVNWQEWNDATELEFKDPSTSVYVEAWTHCGRVYADEFKMVLHPHSVIDACTGFDGRWVENSPTPRTADAYMCTYPNSDFVMMTFNYNSKDNVKADGNTVAGKFTKVACTVKVAESGKLNTVTAVGLPLTWTPDAKDGSFKLAKQFALELVHDKTTAKNTDVRFECTITYALYDSTETKDYICPHEFTITDCDAPDIETKGEEAVCKAGECLAGTGVPGPYEACVGDIFTTSAGTSTVVTAGAHKCCEQCSNTLSCKLMTESAKEGGVGRCEPATPVSMMALALESAAESAMVLESAVKSATASVSETSTSSTALASLSALVAVVALVALKVRVTPREDRSIHMMDDAYLSLMD